MFFCYDELSHGRVRFADVNVAGGKLLLALAVVLIGSANPAAVLAGVESDPNLLKLEMKFFQHDYSKEDAATRLSRIEKLVFGEAKSGDTSARLKNLVAAVPNLNEAAETATTSKGGGASSGADSDEAAPAAAAGGRGNTRSISPDDEMAQRESQITGSSQYPQVSAMERKLFARDYSSEPIAKRLDRLETKVFGRASQSEDLSDRVDQLKSRTGVDLAATPPPGSDWADDEDMPNGGGDITYVPAQTTPYTPSRTPATNLGGSSPVGGGGGGYGMTGRSYSSSGAGDGYTRGGSYGYNPPRRPGGGAARGSAADDDMPQPAPDVVREPAAAPTAAMGLNQRVSLLENEIFNKTYINDTLPARISRLENTVFPGKKTSPDMSLPERVNRLSEVIGSAPSRGDVGNRVAQRPVDDLGDDPSMPRPAPSRSGLSKIINGLGNIITGGGYGAYSMGNSNLVTDPQTGMLVDMYSGNIIDPRTGSVVGNRATGIRSGSYGALPYSGFGSGLSPMGSSYGMSSGFGMGGMRFGSGMGMGGMRMGGMGFGSGMGMPGMGVWP